MFVRRPPRLGPAAAVLFLLTCACGGVMPADQPPPEDLPPSLAEPDRPRIVSLGDSLTAGLGLLEVDSYPALLQARLDEAGYDADVVNSGVSGDTTAGALGRLDWALEGDVRILVVALGGNDALRGLSTDQMRRNLARIIETAQARGIAVLLAGMEAPPNLGESYAAKFREVYMQLAQEYSVPLIPFLLAGVAGHPDLNQADGIHPTAEGAKIVGETVWQALHPMVDSFVAQ